LKDSTDISFVVIGYNEGLTLQGCLESIRSADLKNIAYEVIYIDGGSRDESIKIAETCGVDQLHGGDRHRKAAENRNLGAKFAKGNFIQFLDGDMKINREWVAKAFAFINENAIVASVCGYINESGNGFFKRVLEIDWFHSPGEVKYCGGAALWRREPFLKAGGFPEGVSYGEEPYLCWRIRNEMEMKIVLLNQQMVIHDLGFSGVRDYWRRNIRCGETYSEIASLCINSSDKLYLKETISNFSWGALALVCLTLLFIGHNWLRFLIVIGAALVLARKSIQTFQKNHDLCVSMVYAFHIYFSKLPLALGGLIWWFRSSKQDKLI
jgi:glycosyltransferase involved in cell wall biosynthesis